MASDPSVAEHMKDVSVIFVLGIVYVALLAVGTVASRAWEWIVSAAETGKNTVERVRVRTRSAR